MSTTLLIVQTLNGLQLGVLLFLIAAGLTLVFGVMDFINLAHGVQYMLGAYLAVMFYAYTGNFLFALVLALVAALAFGLLLEFAVFRHLYDRDHLDQVIATFGIILFLNQGVKILWGASPLSLPMPEMFSGSVVLMPGILYPVWRLVIIGSGLGVALILHLLEDLLDLVEHLPDLVLDLVTLLLEVLQAGAGVLGLALQPVLGLLQPVDQLVDRLLDVLELLDRAFAQLVDLLGHFLGFFSGVLAFLGEVLALLGSLLKKFVEFRCGHWCPCLLTSV